MKNKAFNHRKCVFSRQKLLKTQMLRIVKFNDKIVLDLNYTIKGRGLYFVCSQENVKNLETSKIIFKTFNLNLTKDVLEEIKMQIH